MTLGEAKDVARERKFDIPERTVHRGEECPGNTAETGFFRAREAASLGLPDPGDLAAGVTLIKELDLGTTYLSNDRSRQARGEAAWPLLEDWHSKNFPAEREGAEFTGDHKHLRLSILAPGQKGQEEDCGECSRDATRPPICPRPSARVK